MCISRLLVGDGLGGLEALVDAAAEEGHDRVQVLHQVPAPTRGLQHPAGHRDERHEFRIFHHARRP